MLPSRMRPQSFAFRSSGNTRPLWVYIAAGFGAVLVLFTVWGLATMNTPPAQLPITADVSVKL